MASCTHCESGKRSGKAVLRYIGALLIPGLILIDLFPVQPFIKRTAVIEYTVQDHFHPSFMDLFYKSDKESIAGFQIHLICNSLNIFCSMGVIFIPFRQDLSSIFYNLSIMRIDIIIVLTVVLMIGRRYKQRVKIDHIYSQILQIIQFIQNSLKIPSIEIPDVHGLWGRFQSSTFFTCSSI